jgi:hypothetical protein
MSIASLSAKLGDLTVRQSTKFKLVIRLKDATERCGALGLAILSTLLIRTDEVIELGSTCPIQR